MDIGMLWFDDDPRRTLSQKVQRAAQYYADKYGQAATECQAHPVTLGRDAPERIGGIRLTPARNMVRDHFWLGIGEAAQGDSHA